MKKNSFFIFGMLTILLTLGLLACDNGTTEEGNGTAPTLTGFITVTEANGIGQKWIPATSFGPSEREGINCGIKGSDPDKDIVKFVFTIKKGETVIANEESNFSQQAESFTRYIGKFPLTTAGEYTSEVYAIDAKGNKSNTLTTNFSVTD